MVNITMELVLNTNQIALLEALKKSLLGVEPNYPDDIDWYEVIKEAKTHTVIGLISHNIPFVDETAKHEITKYIRILYEQDNLIKLFANNGIPCVILKGIAAAQYYPKPYLRSMGDVDFLVHKNDFLDAVNILENNGYVYLHGKNPTELHQSRDIAYVKNGIEFELHHHFSSFGFDIDDILEQAIDRREYREIDGYTVPVLPDLENGLVLLGHINHHLISRNLGLRQILDWEMYVHNVMDKQVWKESLLPLLSEIGLKKLSVNTTIMCIKYLGLINKIELIVDTEDSASELLLNMVMESGNFGRKKTETALSKYSSLFSYDIYIIKKNGFFSFLRDIGQRKWRLCQKYKILKSFAWIYGLFYSLIKSVPLIMKHGNVKKQINEGNDRYILYEKIGIEADIKDL